ncbi:MAG: hypothetical protein SGJ21_07270, partial [Alphaproteobacteria bacterium]|nr:hypothetical protein [Alphaproteobacteria bacterium]
LALRLSLFSAFLRPFIRQLIGVLANRKPKSPLFPFSKQVGSPSQIRAELNELMKVENYVGSLDVTARRDVRVVDRRYQDNGSTRAVGGSVGLQGAGLSGEMRQTTHTGAETATESDRSFLTVFKFGHFVDDLRDILAKYDVKTIYVIVDDFSELKDPLARKLLMREVIHPLEVATDELFKFKIAVYPGQYDTEPLESTRIETIQLDPAYLYIRRAVGDVEEAAIDYLARLLKRRFDYFSPLTPMERFFGDTPQTVHRLLYEVSFCNPRALGWILNYAAEEKLEQGRPLTPADIRLGAKRYYERLIFPRISGDRVLSAPVGERDKIFVSKAVLETTLREAKRLRSYKESEFLRKIVGDNPTSHFYVDTRKEDILDYLSSLQLVNFVRTASDKSGNEVAIYAVDYGLCEHVEIKFGRPIEQPNAKDYWVQRIFDYTSPLVSVAERLELYRCNHCNKTRSVAEESTLAVFSFRCPDCFEGVLSKQLAALPPETEAISTSTPDLSNVEFNILSVLNGHKKGGALSAKEISPAIDVSSHHVAHFAKRLVDEGYIERTRKSVGRPYQYAITETARSQFFAVKVPPSPTGTLLRESIADARLAMN